MKKTKVISMDVVRVKTGHSVAKDEKSAIKEAVISAIDKFKEGDLSFVVLFASSNYNPKKLMAEYNKINKLKGVPMIGCTTAGEMDEVRFSRGGLVFFALSSKYVRAAAAMAGKMCKNPFKA